MFCALTLCETQPCAFGQCKLTPTSYACTCLPSYTGSNCEQKLKPCADNPCEGRGECFERGDTFHCRCHAWWEGQRCERRMLHIPFKPLSERMLQEPFWLGLITVTVVLGVIGLVWCAKRHFPEKLEKLLAEEADRSRTGCSSHSRPPSVREQLATAGGATVVVVPSPQPGCPRSLFGRLGIRKPSLLSLTSPHGHNNHPTAASATARTFSLDDLLKPPPRRTPSPRKKRNNSTPTKKNIAEKKQILQQLITPSANQQHPRKVSLGELIQLSERKMKEADKSKEGEETETTFSTVLSDSQSAPSTAALSSIDAKFEKKVTFARLLSKVSAEMSSGSEMEANQTRHPQLSGLPRSNSTPPSPAADTRSPHSTSSNQGSDSMSSLDATLPLGSGQTVTELLANRRPNRLLQQSGKPIKNPSADSILAMFRNFSSATSGPASHKVSPSTTPTASSPQDDVAGSDESSTSSVPTPMSSSSFTLDSPPLPHAFHRNTIEVPVLDALSAHKTAIGGSNLLQPPTILLEIPSGGIGKCLSPIREVPTPLATPSPSPALTPIMPRSAPPYLRSRDEQISILEPGELDMQLPCITITNSDDEEDSEEKAVEVEVTDEVAKSESNPTTSPAPDKQEEVLSIQIPLSFKMKASSAVCNNVGPVLVVDEETSEECAGGETGCCEAESANPHPIIPLLTIQQASPIHRIPVLHLPGSPPPHRGGHAEPSFPFPGKGPRRLLKELDKPNSLDLPCPPPLITVTCNMSEAESDTESISPAAKTVGPHPGVTGGGVGMCYLSPFSMCSRADRTASESNLSSSGYSSMASPGPSRCGSNNPLCPSEVEEPPGSGTGHTLVQRKPSPLLRTPATSTCEGEAERPPEDRGLQGGHCRGRSDSETLSDDLFVESNDEGIGTDHLDEKIEEGELKSAKELEVFIGKELLENGKTLLGLPSILPTPPVTKCGSVDAGLDCCKSSLQLPSIVVQADPGGCDKHLSPVSSRSESPLSDKTAGLGRFSPLFYGRHKSDQLPFTDSDGLYDCPSSDCPLNRVQASTTVQQHRKSTGRRRERRSASRGGGGNKTPSPTKITTFLDVPGIRPVAPRKPSPKRSRTRSQPRVSSSSSSESLNSTRELTLRSSSEKTINPDRVSWPGAITGQTELDWGNEGKGHLSVEASGEDTGEEVTSQMLPKILAREDIPKPHRKVSRLRTIGHQIRFLRRLELSLKRRERLVSPSDSVDSCGEEEEEGSPPSLSPLLSHHQCQQELHKSSSFGHLQQAARGGRGRQKLKRLAGIELQDRPWHHVHVTGGSGHTD
ncbi:uncharacterized protein [Periplaneta americana]|uniref:uncharacterized protein n=1 Tax=Periplaneta americana TaxID=6978 RepID=UPI0037E956ED